MELGFSTDGQAASPGVTEHQHGCTCLRHPSKHRCALEGPASFFPIRTKPAFLLGKAADLWAHSVWWGSFLADQVLPPCGSSQGRALPQETPIARLVRGRTAQERGRSSSISIFSWSHSPSQLLGRRRQTVRDGKGTQWGMLRLWAPGPGAAQGSAQAVAQGPDNGHCSPPEWSVLSPAIACILLHVIWEAHAAPSRDRHSRAEKLGSEWDGQGRGCCHAAP